MTSTTVNPLSPAICILIILFVWIIIGIIFMAIEKYNKKASENHIGDKFYKYTIIPLVILVAICVVTLIVGPSQTSTEVTKLEEEDLSIVALYEGNHYLYQTPEGIKQDISPIEQTTIHLTDGEAMLHKTSKTTFERTAWWWFFEWSEEKTETFFDFYVPEKFLNP